MLHTDLPSCSVTDVVVQDGYTVPKSGGPEPWKCPSLLVLHRPATLNWEAYQARERLTIGDIILHSSPGVNFEFSGL
jgi:hypothetical protein